MTRMVAALDVGGTTVKAALLDEELKPQATLREQTARSADGKALAEQVADIVTRLSEQAGTGAPAAVGVVVPGIVDEEIRVCHFSANLAGSPSSASAPVRAARRPRSSRSAPGSRPR